MQKYKVNKAIARALEADLQNVDMVSLIQDLLCLALIKGNNNDDAICIAREMIPLITNRSEDNYLNLLDAYRIDEIKMVLHRLLTYYLSNDTWASNTALMRLYEFTVIIDSIYFNTTIEKMSAEKMQLNA